MTRFGEFPPLKQNLKVLCQLTEGLIYLSFVKASNPIMAKTAIGQIFIVVKGQTLKNNLAIRSHWLRGQSD